MPELTPGELYFVNIFVSETYPPVTASIMFRKKEGDKYYFGNPGDSNIIYKEADYDVKPPKFGSWTAVPVSTVVKGGKRRRNTRRAQRNRGRFSRRHK